jgi:hypothetical protein
MNKKFPASLTAANAVCAAPINLMPKLHINVHIKSALEGKGGNKYKESLLT